MLNMTITQKQPVITTLLKSQQNGVKHDDIIGLSKIIDLGRMAKEWNYGLGQRGNVNNGNNISNNLGISR